MDGVGEAGRRSRRVAKVEDAVEELERAFVGAESGSQDDPDAAAVAKAVRNEFVLEITGKVAHRLPGTENAKLATGEIEVQAGSVQILNEAQTPPFRPPK